MTDVRAAIRRNGRTAGAIIALAALGLTWTVQSAFAGGQNSGMPADKVAVAASDVRASDPIALSTGSEDPMSVEFDLLETDMRVSSPSDLILSVTAECALWTNTSTMGDDDQESVARMEVWVEIEGKTVPVSATQEAAGVDTGDPDQAAKRGRIVFCNRAQRMITENFVDTEEETDDDDANDLIRLYNRTRSSHGFNWVAVNVGGTDYDTDGDNIVNIVVKARLASQVFCEKAAEDDPACVSQSETPAASNFVGGNSLPNPAARAAVGKRTLVIEPTKLVNDAST